MARGTQMCQGYTKTGAKCQKSISITNTTGYCRPEHQTNHQNMLKNKGSATASAIAATVGAGQARTSSIKQYSPSEQGVDQGRLYSNLDPELFKPLDRNVIPEKDAENWNNPVVQDCAARLGLMEAQSKRNNELMGKMESVIQSRFTDKDGNPLVGEHILKDSKGRPAGKMSIQWKDGNFSAKALEANVDKELSDDYAVNECNPKTLKEIFPDAYEKMRNRKEGAISVDNSQELNDSLEDMYFDRYEGKPIDEDKLKNWFSASLGHEILRIRKENGNLKKIIDQDKDDLKYALPANNYSTSTESGLDSTIKIGKPTYAFNQSNIKNLDQSMQDKIKSTPGVWQKKYTAASVKKGDKTHKTSYWSQGKNKGSYKSTFSDV